MKGFMFALVACCVLAIGVDTAEAQVRRGGVGRPGVGAGVRAGARVGAGIRAGARLAAPGVGGLTPAQRAFLLGRRAGVNGAAARARAFAVPGYGYGVPAAAFGVPYGVPVGGVVPFAATGCSCGCCQ